METQTRPAADPRDIYHGYDDGQTRILHTMVLTSDMERSLRFYVDGLGMKVLSDKFESPAFKVTALFVGYRGVNEGGSIIELVEPWENKGAHRHGEGYTHICIGVADREAMLVRLEAMGVECERRPLAVFVRDPDGYEFEIVQTRRG
ncbi:MAG TPA: VOC family protein [Novosphingobium sp.]|nr:VOC family protein [Novosphingobium sp.]